jgi:hypothetical protein
MIRKLALAATCATLFACAAHGKYDAPGLVTEIKEDRIWVFKPDSAELAEFRKTGELAKQYTSIGGGPDGMTVKAASPSILKEYLDATKGR